VKPRQAGCDSTLLDKEYFRPNGFFEFQKRVFAFVKESDVEKSLGKVEFS